MKILISVTIMIIVKYMLLLTCTISRFRDSDMVLSFKII